MAKRRDFARQPLFYRALVAALFLAIAIHSHGLCRADVIVLANRTGRELPLRFAPVAGQAQQLILPIGDTAPFFLDGRANVSFSSPAGPKQYLLDSNSAYYFGRGPDGRVDLQKIGIGDDGTAATGRSLPGSASRAQAMTIPIKILVDEEEPGRQYIWERRLRRRIAAASAILQKYCGVTLSVTEVGTWNSDNSTNDFIKSLAEFEREVKPAPARLAIGFTSQWTMVRGRTHMAGTRGPFHTHILVREGSPQISEPERLEFLVHELGHHLGAAHSPEQTSVMRPVLGDNQAGRSDFQIQFDPVNALVVGMICEELRRRNVNTLSALLPETKRRLQQIYIELARSLPNDPAGLHYVGLMSSAQATPLVAAARGVLKQITTAALENRALPPAQASGPTPTTRLEGDALTEHYIRVAARAADSLSDNVAVPAFLLAIGRGLDDADAGALPPAAASLANAIELPSERRIRLTALGQPTLRGRRDLAKRFFAHIYLTAATNAETSREAGVSKELYDIKNGGGFNFAELAAGRAGIRFAEGLSNKNWPLGLMTRSFDAAKYVPTVDGLPEELAAADFKSNYGARNDPRFRKLLQEIDGRILVLPAYRKADVSLTR